MKKIVYFMAGLVCFYGVVLLVTFHHVPVRMPEKTALETEDLKSQTETGAADEKEPDTAEEIVRIDSDGMTLQQRVRTPEGYERVPAEPDSFAAFLRDYLLKEDKSPVLLYDGRRKKNQNAHAAVFALPLEGEDLQQCADSVLRLYAEYFRKTNQNERIVFHFVNGGDLSF